MNDFTKTAFIARAYDVILRTRCINRLRALMRIAPMLDTNFRSVELKMDVRVSQFCLSRRRSLDESTESTDSFPSNTRPDGVVFRFASEFRDGPDVYTYVSDTIMRCTLELSPDVQADLCQYRAKWTKQYRIAERYYLANKDNEDLDWLVC
ncbi:uncharacterized protein AB675_5193 [Cyphellophora attinorum]|uniref:Uncharacterized protein n=1 Tax=Cyphellophora attinorum TaxID=1664694 RepID=A0A0N1HNR5_9EURO|nr:uncharacterized protein AB675_5193 [Phialophora attinorum]KPI39227.1 hypothetical protein AB675_5193 [Phialophora attinorum]